MPAGTSVIHASVNGKPGVREVHVDASTAERLQRDLVEKLEAAATGKKARPCGLFDHKDGRACLLPKRFFWDDAKGVMLEADWTQAGKAAVEGRDYSYWSPCFRLGKDGRVVGLTGGVEVGSLVNNPAFETIARIAAAKAEVDEPGDDVVEVNGGAVEVDAAHCNQYQHVPGCKNGGGSGGGKEDASGGSVEKLKKDIERLEQDFRSKRGEYAQLLNDSDYGYVWDDDERAHLKENLRKAEEAAEQAAKKLREARIALADEYRKLGETAKADWLMLEDELDSGPWLDYGDNVKSSKPEDTEPEDHIAKMGLAELRAELGKRHATPVVERIKARIAELEKREDEGAEPEGEKELSPLKRAHLAALEKWRKSKERKAAKDADLQDVQERVRLAAACGKCKPVIENVRERVKAANPYGCNQYGHGFKAEHKGYGAGGQKTLEFDGTDKEHQERKKAFEEAVQKRKERDRKSAERRKAEIDKYGLESKREKYERMARERDEKHAAAVKKAEDELRDVQDEWTAVWRRGENDEWTDALTKKKAALEKQEKALQKKLDDAKRKQADWEGKKKRNWEYDKKWGTSTLFR